MYAQDRTGHGGQRQKSQAELLGGTQDPLEAQALIPKPCPQAQLCWMLQAGPAPTWSQPWARHSPLCHSSRAQPPKPRQDSGLPASPANQPSCWDCAGAILQHAGAGLSLRSSFPAGAGGVAVSCCAVRQAASRLERPGWVPRSWQHVRGKAGESRLRQAGKQG